MLLLKILGSLMIIASSSLIGYTYGIKYSKRVKNLIYLQNCIQLLETEIIYSATPLPEALENIYRKGNKNVSFIFKDIKEYLTLNRSTSISKSFSYVFNSSKENLCLEGEDIEVFLSLGRSLGASDRFDQEKHFKTALIQIQIQQKGAEESKNKNEKLYKNLGVLAGFAIVLFLF